MENVTVGLALVAGILSFISPCVLPLVPAYVGYMAGRMTHIVALQTAGEGIKNEAKRNSAAQRAGMLLHSAAFVLGFTLVFVAIGLMTTAFFSVLGTAVNTITDIIGRVGGIIIILFGLQFMGFLPSIFRNLKRDDSPLDKPVFSFVLTGVISLLILWAFVEPLIALPVLAAFWLALLLGGAFAQPGHFWRRIIAGFEGLLYSDTRGDMQDGGRKGLWGSFVMGIVFSAGWTPCIGPLLGTILTLASQTGEVTSAMTLLTAYSLGLGIPFILTALLLDGAQGVLRRLQRHMRAIELVSGGFLVLIGVLVASGQLQSLSQNWGNQFADLSYRMEECGIGVIAGDLQVNQLGSCLGGTLHPISINQSTIVSITENTPSLEYVFRVEEATAIDVEISRLESDTAPLITLYHDNEEILARSDTLQQRDEDVRVAMTGIMLPEPGLYRLIISDAIGLRFRLKVIESEAIALSEDTETGPAVSALMDSIGSIEEMAEASGPATGLEIGNRAPDFTVITDTGDTVSLSDLRGKVVALNFWGTWCGPCRREMPEFQDVYEARAEEGFIILGMAVRDNLENVQDFREEFGLTFLLAVDEGNEVNDLYAIQRQPSTYIIDQDGIIRERHFNIITTEQLNDALDATLTG